MIKRLIILVFYFGLRFAFPELGPGVELSAAIGPFADKIECERARAGVVAFLDNSNVQTFECKEVKGETL